jgi:glucokinase
MENFLGIDIGGTNVKVGLVRSDGTLLAKEKYKTAELLKKGIFMDNLFDIVGSQLQKYPEVKKVGIGVPGTITKDRKNTIDLPNVPKLSNQPVQQLLQERFPHITFHLENDANAAAIGELYFAKPKPPANFIFITLGTGVGGGVVLDGKIFKGGDGNGMEIGHIISGNGKTVEANIGKKGIVEIALMMVKKFGGKSELKNIKPKELTYKDVEKALLMQDKLAARVFEEVGNFLGEALVSAIRILDIKYIIIGGGIADELAYLERSMYATIWAHLPNYYLKDLKIVKASLGNEAGILGAASLCFIEE